jgi:predicted dithiol-disulfide oxidoreductase (DUF899 family)
MPEHRTATREEWEAESAKLLEREKQLTRMGDELARQRRELPWVKVESEYTFQTADGPKTLAELFDGRSQLIVYHFMFGPDWEAGCPVCSTIGDTIDGALAHVEARDARMICISRAPIEKLLAYRQRLGWKFNWASSYENDYNWDLERSATREVTSEWVDQAPPFVTTFASSCGTDVAGYFTERPGLSVYARSAEGDVYRTYSTTARGLEVVMAYYGILDRLPRGRDEDDPVFQSWIRRHDEYGQASDAAAGG